MQKKKKKSSYSKSNGRVGIFTFPFQKLGGNQTDYFNTAISFSNQKK